MRQNIEDLLVLLSKVGCDPKLIDRDLNTNFSRTIQFHVIGLLPCYIEWFCNESTLSIGGKYTSYITFTDVMIDNTWPSFRKGLKFLFEGVVVARLTLEKLGWQEIKGDF